MPHTATITCAALLLLGSVLALRKPRRWRPLWVASLCAFVLLMVPSLIAIATGPHRLRAPEKVWTVTLQKSTWDAMNTGSEFAATRHMAFAGDRLIAVYEAAMAPYQGKQPMAEYALESLDVHTGAVQDEKRFVGQWGAMPSLYSAQGDDLVLAASSLNLLRSDLKDAGPHFDLTRGRVEQMSPDGSTVAWETTPGISLIKVPTLTPTGVRLDASVATSVSRDAVLTDNISWLGAYPKESSFVTLTDAQGEHLVYHGRCGGRPEFLTGSLIFVAGCGTVRLLDLQGHLVHETAVAGNARFAGVSQNGKRFAVAVSESRGDPSVVLFEHFILFDTETGQPLAMVRTEHMPENQSWSAFSSDGTLFASGDASALSLYKVP